MSESNFNTERFIAKAEIVHNNKYSYVDSIYIGAREKIKIKCFEHGDFSQIASNHLSGSGCPSCGNENIANKNKISLKVIKDRISKKHGDYYRYDFPKNPKLSESIRISCPKHGWFVQNLRVHTLGSGCPSCGRSKAAKYRTSGKIDFERKAKKIHGNKYDYSSVVYVNAKTHVDIKCPEHGVFKQSPCSHLNGSGCKVCNKSHGIGFSKKGFIAKSAKTENVANLYFVRISGNGEEFYKIGITTRNVDFRMRKITKEYGKDVVMVLTLNSSVIYDMEKNIHADCADFKYTPKIKFCGYTECFTMSHKDLCNVIEKYTM